MGLLQGVVHLDSIQLILSINGVVISCLMYNAVLFGEGRLLLQDLLNLAMWCAKWGIKLNPEKNKVIIFSRSKLARITEPNLKLYGETLKVYPPVKFLGITFDSQLTFKKHFEDILDPYNTW